MSMFIDSNEAEMSGTRSGNSANPGAGGVANQRSIAGTIIQSTGVFVGMAIAAAGYNHSKDESDVWKQEAMWKLKLRTQGQSSDVVLAKAQQETDAFHKAEKERKEAEAAAKKEEAAVKKAEKKKPAVEAVK